MTGFERQYHYWTSEASMRYNNWKNAEKQGQTGMAEHYKKQYEDAQRMITELLRRESK